MKIMALPDQFGNLGCWKCGTMVDEENGMVVEIRFNDGNDNDETYIFCENHGEPFKANLLKRLASREQYQVQVKAHKDLQSIVQEVHDDVVQKMQAMAQDAEDEDEDDEDDDDFVVPDGIPADWDPEDK